jgi:uncharacterized protein (DUF2225 family)
VPTKKKPITCPHCEVEFTPEELLTLRAKINGSITSEKKKAASRLNGLKGGQHKPSEA